MAARAAGEPEREGLPRAEVVVSRAFAEPARWLPLAARYLAPGGRVLATLGREADEEALRGAGAAARLELVSLRRFELPVSRSHRAVAVFVPSRRLRGWPSPASVSSRRCPSSSPPARRRP